MSKNIDISLIQFSKYVREKEVENKFKGWVLNGKNNENYKYIIDCNNGSPTNGSINRSYTDLIIGRGLSFKPSIGESSKNAQDWARLKTILSETDLKRIATDFQVFGAASVQIETKKNNEILRISHLEKNKVVPSIKNEEGVIEGYWFSMDWENQIKPENKPVYYPAFGTSNEGVEISVIKPYHVGQNYFEVPDYISGIQYAESEMEISNMNLTSIKNGLSTGFIINVKNGINLTSEEKKEFKKKVTDKLTGTSNGGNFIISMNGSDVEIEVVPFPTNSNVHKQWETLNDTCAQKILTAHRCTSPSIAGIVSSSGFSNTADEMDMAESQLLKRVIAPKQKYITNGLEEILKQYDINLDLYFLPLTEEKQADNGLELSSVEKKKNIVNADDLIKLGEDLPEGYEIISDERCEEITLKESDLNTVFQFASVPVTPRKKSEQDTSIFKIRYRYAGSSTGEREFCNKVLNADKLYRAEDLDFNSNYNEDFSPKGKNSYNVFLYKGGVNCKHWWQRVVLMKSNNEQISVNQARKMILELEPGKERKDAEWEQNPKQVAESASPLNNYWSLKPGYRL